MIDSLEVGDLDGVSSGEKGFRQLFNSYILLFWKDPLRRRGSEWWRFVIGCNELIRAM